MISLYTPPKQWHLVFILCLNFFALTAQETSRLKLLDKESGQAIQGATFSYAAQQGSTDSQGQILFNYKPGAALALSHLNYGTWTIADSSLKQALANKSLFWQKLTFKLYPVTVIALRPSANPQEKISLDYEEQLAHDVAVVLNQNPALNSIRKGGNYGFDPVFRGFKYDQLNIVFNGSQGATAACPNRMDPPTSQMAPNMLARIEVLKGPHALRYGTGLGATINFIPTPLRFTEKAAIYGRASTGFEGNGNVWRNEAKIGLSNQKQDIALFGSWSQGDDYTTGNGQAVPAAFKRASFGSQIGLKLSKQQDLRLTAIYNVARDAAFAALPMDLRTDDTWLFNAHHSINFKGKQLQSLNSSLFASFVDHLMDNLLKPLNPRMLNASTSAQTFNFGGRTEGLWRFKQAKLYTGADLRREGAKGIRTRSFLMGPNAGNSFKDNAWQESAITKTGLFTAYHLNLNKTRLVLATRLELNTADIKDPAAEFTATNSNPRVSQFNPSFSLGATKNLHKNLSIGLWLARAQRSGSLTERYINFFPVGQDPYELVGNPKLKAEKNNQLDLNLQWQTTTSKIGADLFVSYLQDYISSFIVPSLNPRLPNSPGVRQFANIAAAFKTGLEINYSQELLPGLQHRIGMAYTYAKDLERKAPLPEIAPLDFRYTLTGDFINEKLKPEITFRQVLQQNRIATAFGETTSEAFSLLDAHLSFKLSKHSQIKAGVNNIFDNNYYEHLSRSVRGANGPIYAPGRNAFTSINLVF